MAYLVTSGDHYGRRALILMNCLLLDMCNPFAAGTMAIEKEQVVFPSMSNKDFAFLLFEDVS